MTYTINESLTAKNFTPGQFVGQIFGTPRRIESITIHHWGAFGQTGPGVLDWFCNPASSVTTSAHFVVWDGNIYCIVSPTDAAWAAGNAYGNATSIHIECHPEATDGDYAAVAWLVSWLRANYGADLPLFPHNHWTETSCPGIWDLGRIDSLARGVQPQSSTTTPIGDFLMALSDADQQLLLTQIKYISSPAFKHDIFAGASDVERAARQAFYDELVHHDFAWMGFNGQPQPAGGRTTTNIATDLGYADSRSAGEIGLLKAILADGGTTRDYVHSVLAAALSQILAGQGKAEVDPAVVQAAIAAAFATVPPPTVDNAAIATAVNDEADARERARLA
jgi:hypothetical protein